MKKIEEQTKEKILLSTLALFSERGISQTSVNEIAYRAGVTRVTVYRHFPDKEALVLAAFLRVEQVFEKGLVYLKQDPQASLDTFLDQIGAGLRSLPSGDVFARAEELKRLYPDAYRSVQEVREATLNGLFELISAMARRQGLMRPGLNREIVQAVFWQLTINLFDNPRFQSIGLSDAELFHAITDLLLHGMLKSTLGENQGEGRTSI
jgi:AcrR family transcriptional regulator